MPLKPWFRNLLIADAIVFVGGIAGILFYSGGGPIPAIVVLGYAGATAVLAVVILILYLWQARR